MTKIEKEKRTVELMIGLYCRAHHGGSELCQECAALRDYAHERLSHCQFGENKKKCKACTVHCYRPDMREAIRKVMRYSGPRMLFHHPIITLQHMFS